MYLGELMIDGVMVEFYLEGNIICCYQDRELISIISIDEYNKLVR